MLNHSGQPPEPDPYNSTTAHPCLGKGPASLNRSHRVTSMEMSRARTSVDRV